MPQPQNKKNEPEIIKTVDLYKRREKIYTRAFEGFHRNLRNYGGALLFLIYFGTVWVNWGDRQAVLWDLSTRQFYIFGETFLPQDFILLSWMLIICAFGLFFITVLAGRVWCGYTCPQSVFTWVFMWVEKITEGDRNKRMRLDKAPMSATKFTRKLAKHILWLLISLAVAITFVGYFTPIRELTGDLITAQASAWAVFWVGFFTLATYGNAGWLREQVCIYMCPYARFQSVMYDRDTLTVHYDATRGEPRGPRKRSADPKELGIGDCIDCNLCVHVCPTDIDIRDGLQYECISCGACVDACNGIMDKMNYDRGLIRYTSEGELDGSKPNLLRPRLIAYFIALCVMTGLFVFTLTQRTVLEFEVLRDRQGLYTTNSQGLVENIYTLKLVNKSQQPHTLTISVSGIKGATLRGETRVTLEPGSVASLPVRLAVSPDALTGPKTNIVFHADNDSTDGPAAETESRFLSPNLSPPIRSDQ
ncbi:cytochrome c oxidase accessory protein CcoG [Sansalvadorimonas verongulae]|uniref:cytochrome c oxidase accessory protein CcoG n=1 Tax=Sansalvadorimonas verongulae TaxID=2172824 RepID=UPI0012BCCDCB|nr:cytochrome c oxidase accessory protein CcoG [Sansalvadorimonas verongulae]MTI12463.1 cytochrome c oxidase accessory protein CcoG [Sansalvadorimonas verongulae]